MRMPSTGRLGASISFAALLTMVALTLPSSVMAQASMVPPLTPFERVVAALDRTAGIGIEHQGVVLTARLPACRFEGQATRFGKVREWRRTMLDTNVRVEADYEPFDLVSVSRARIAGSGKVRKLMLDDLAAMAKAARKAGKPLGVRSAHRSHQTQKAIFDREVRRVGRKRARKFVARPGHSEHQLGTTIDFTAAGGGALTSRFGASPAGKWLARNGWKYGFVLSYPKGRKRASCYGYEPWHWRYFGRGLAAEIHASGQVPRRFLWQNSESVP